MLFESLGEDVAARYLGLWAELNQDLVITRDPDDGSRILEEAAKLTEEVLLPLNQIGDREGCTRIAVCTIDVSVVLQRLGYPRHLKRRYFEVTGNDLPRGLALVANGGAILSGMVIFLEK